MKKLFVVTVALLSLTSFAVAAQSKKAADVNAGAKNAYASFDKKFAKVKGKLNLTADQAAQVNALDQQLTAKQESVKTQLSQAKSANATKAQIADIKQTAKNNIEDYRQSVTQILTPEQNDQLDSLLQKAAKKKSKK